MTIAGVGLGRASAELDGQALEVIAADEDGTQLVVRTPVGTGALHELVVVQHAVSADAPNPLHNQRSAPVLIESVGHLGPFRG